MTIEEAKRTLIQYADDCADCPSYEDMQTAIEVVLNELDKKAV